MNIYNFSPALDVGFKHYCLTDRDHKRFFGSSVWKKYIYGKSSVESDWQPLTMEWSDPNNPRNWEEEGDEFFRYTGVPATMIGDFAWCPSFTGSIYSERAVQILSPYLGESVEFLPLKCDDGIFYACKVLSIMDNALNLEKSKIEWEPQTKKDKENNARRRFRAIKEYVFNEDVIEDLLIFIQVQDMWELYVTQWFVDIVNEHGLTGGKFVQVYPPEDPNEIRRRAYEKAMKRRKKNNQKGKSKDEQIPTD
jgi:hypothetical protein